MAGYGNYADPLASDILLMEQWGRSQKLLQVRAFGTEFDFIIGSESQTAAYERKPSD